MHRWFFLLLGSWLVASAASASTIVPPADLGELARISDAVVFAQAQDSWSEPGGVLPRTVTRFRLLRPVSGAALPSEFEVAEPGGEIANTGVSGEAEPSRVVIAGSPDYRKGKKYVLFLERVSDQRWRSKMLAYGLLEEVEGMDLLRPLPDAPGVAAVGKKRYEPVGVYRKQELFRHLGELSLGMPWDRKRVEAPPEVLVDLEVAVSEMASAEAPIEAVSAAAVTPPTGCAFLNSGGVPFRAFGHETGAQITIAPTTPGQALIADGGVSAVQQAVAAWTNHPDSVIRYVAGPTRARSIACGTGGFTDNDPGAVVFNDPCGDIQEMSGCSGVLAVGGVAQGGGGGTFDGQTWFGIVTPFVVVNNGAGCLSSATFAEMMTHEVGHSIGFGHHTGGLPGPTMSATLTGDGRGAALGPRDKTCAAFAYHTFRDVSSTYWAWKWIEAVENRGVTGGCGSGNFCPEANITRDQMAIFLLKAKEGPAYNPPSCFSPLFTDVGCGSTFSPWINELLVRGVTGGCGNGAYCPGGLVTREQMAVFLLKTLMGPAYLPPACTTPVFNDVPCSNPFAPWINALVARGVTSGCSAGSYCPGSPVTRAQMSVFLSATFNLPTP